VLLASPVRGEGRKSAENRVSDLLEGTSRQENAFPLWSQKRRSKLEKGEKERNAPEGGATKGVSNKA